MSLQSENENEKKSRAERVEAIILDCFFTEEEMSRFEEGGMTDANAQGFVRDHGGIIVDVIISVFGFNKERIEAHKEEIKQLIKEAATDEFLKGKGGGSSFLALCMDRDGKQWADHATAAALVGLSIAAGMGGLGRPGEPWSMRQGGVPYVWFEDFH